jgi:rhodanese-related sulfurtransferase
MPKGFKDYLAEANAQVETCSVQDALRLHGRNDWVFVDVRDAGEVEMTGKIPEAVHASRGLLEFRIDPTSPMHDPALAAGPKKRFVFYCGTGGRSALAALRATEMGLGEVISMAGGFNAWKAADGPIEGGSDA